tara:strand:- start:71 stop:2761 length:2691 start_codon:yes stop_codon:yes gene_type:complete
MKHLLFAPFLLMLSTGVLGQVLITDGYAEACSGVLYDSSGQGGAGYGPAEDFMVTLCPGEDGSSVLLQWINFDLDPSTFMTIYDGDSDASPALAFSGYGSFLFDVHQASEGNSSGCLTLHFVSSASYDSGGSFIALIGCDEVSDCESNFGDFNLNGVCDNLEIYGCRYPAAINFEEGATIDDNSCIFPCDGDLDANGEVGVTDLLALLAAFQTSCVYGCIDSDACNFNPLANAGNNTCLYLDASGACGGSCVVDQDQDGICDNDDDCVGALDECGICNGPGPTEVVLDVTTLYDSVYAEGIDTWFVYEVGADTSYSFICDPTLANCEAPIVVTFYNYGSCALGLEIDNVLIDSPLEPLELNVLQSDSAVVELAVGGQYQVNTFFLDSVSCTDADTVFTFDCGSNYNISFGFESDGQWNIEQEVPFQCGDSVMHGGKAYPTVLVEGQCWFAENLAYFPADSSEVTPAYDLSGSIPTTVLFDTFGLFYSQEVISENEICPSGWRVPLEEDFTRLQDVIGYELRDTTLNISPEGSYFFLNWTSSCATFPNGFNARPGGFIASDGLPVTYVTNSGYFSGGVDARFGCQQEFIGPVGLSFSLGSSCSGNVNRVLSSIDFPGSAYQCSAYPNHRYSIRCIQDTDVLNRGCISDFAMNYDLDAEVDDGSCLFDIAQQADTIVYWGKSYPTVVLGERRWFAKDLESPFFSNGDAASEAGPQDPWGDPCILSGAWTSIASAESQGCNSFLFGESAAISCLDPELNLGISEELSGFHYNEATIQDSRGICPSGWHVSNDDDWKSLESFFGMSEVELDLVGNDFRGSDTGKLIKSDSLWWNDGNGYNAAGLGLQPGGVIPFFGRIYQVHTASAYWSPPYYRTLDSHQDGVQREESYPGPMQVRCVEN